MVSAFDRVRDCAEIYWSEAFTTCTGGLGRCMQGNGAGRRVVAFCPIQKPVAFILWVAHTIREALEWNIQHTMWHCGQIGMLSRLPGKRWPFGLAVKGGD